MELKENIKTTEIQSKAFKLFVEDNGKVVARASIFLITNDSNERPYGLLEDLFVNEEYRSEGIGSQLVQTVIDKAKKEGCYKFVATSRYERPWVHKMYEKLGMKDYGKEFRIDFE